jgi:hypothetical protein
MAILCPKAAPNIAFSNRVIKFTLSHHPAIAPNIFSHQSAHPDIIASRINDIAPSAVLL